MIVTTLAAILFSFLIAFIVTPFVKKLSFWFGAVALPNHRSVHKTAMPRMGGFAIFIAFLVGVLLFSFIKGLHPSTPFIGILIGAIIIELVGVIDDKVELSAKKKLLGQCIAAIVVIAFGLKIDFVHIPFGSANVGLNDFISIPITFLWIVGVTNAINLLDGLDGLAGGVSAIASATIMSLAFMMGNMPVAVLSGALLGSLLGFLPYNFNPAKIFMGESGSAFLGFILGSISIFGFKQAAIASFVVPIMILGVPISDTLFAMIRRKKNKTPIFRADMGHLHHQLLRLGFSQKKVVGIIYAISLFFGICAVLMSQSILWMTVVITFITVLLLVVGAEIVEVFSKKKKPVLQLIRKLMKVRG